jgi:hypothetical protein
MNSPSDFSAQAHMPKACEAKRAGAKKDKKPAGGAK